LDRLFAALNSDEAAEKEKHGFIAPGALAGRAPEALPAWSGALRTSTSVAKRYSRKLRLCACADMFGIVDRLPDRQVIRGTTIVWEDTIDQAPDR